MLEAGVRQRLLSMLLNRPREEHGNRLMLRRSTEEKWNAEQRMRAREREVRHLLESRQTLGPLQTIEQRLERLRDWAYVGSQRHQDLIWKTDWSGAHVNLRAFEARYVSMAADAGIPMHCGERRPCAIQMFQSQYRDLVHELDWEVLEVLGQTAAKSLNLEVKWMGAQAEGWWTVNCVQEVRDWRLPRSLRQAAQVDRDWLNAELDKVVDATYRLQDAEDKR